MRRPIVRAIQFDRPARPSSHGTRGTSVIPPRGRCPGVSLPPDYIAGLTFHVVGSPACGPNDQEANRSGPMRKSNASAGRSTRQGRTRGAEPRVVRIKCRPAPDADFRVRRLFSLLVKCAAKDRPPDAPEGPPGTRSC